MAEITPGQAYGFFTDTSVCIGCKACEVACKEWNQLPGNKPAFGDGFDNTGSLDSQNWRHVRFIDNVPDQTQVVGQGKAWLLMSDVCKHCAHASCMEVCPTGAIIRTEFDSVFIQPSVCNGCRSCIAACPYSVIGMDETTNVAQKCTLCYDRLQGGLEPACAKACPTQSIQFGPISELRARAQQRVANLHSQGVSEARLYGGDDSAVTSVVHAAGHQIGGSGNATFSGRLATGDTSGALFGPGLVNPTSADIHLVVYDHGALNAQEIAAGIHGFEPCEPECVDLQYSPHEQ